MGPASPWRRRKGVSVPEAGVAQSVPGLWVPTRGRGALPSCVARKGVTAKALIFPGFRSSLQFPRPKGWFVLSGEVSVEQRAATQRFPATFIAFRKDACPAGRWRRGAV